MSSKIVVIGGGPAGLAAAIQAKKSGVDNVVILERSTGLGGILMQCIHNGFGLHRFGEELTGPEYAWLFIDEVKTLNIEVKTNCMVLSLSEDKIITYISPEDGYTQIKADAVVLAMGCRERSRGALSIPGARPAGVYSAGTAQKFVNIDGYMPGKKVVILGSGDIGLIMARRMTYEGASVEAVCELMPYSSGLTRNIVQCLNDYEIPLFLETTVTRIHGEDRVTGVSIAKVDKHRQPIPETEKFIECDTLLLSVGLIPENELSEEAGIDINRITNGPIVDNYTQTSIPGIFACGNVLHVHDLVDYVSEEAETAGYNAALYVKSEIETTDKRITCIAQNNIRYIIPNTISLPFKETSVTLFMRSSNVFKNKNISVKVNNKIIKSVKKQIIVPGEMQTIKLSKEIINDLSPDDTIIISIEDE